MCLRARARDPTTDRRHSAVPAVQREPPCYVPVAHAHATASGVQPGRSLHTIAGRGWRGRHARVCHAITATVAGAEHLGLALAGNEPQGKSQGKSQRSPIPRAPREREQCAQESEGSVRSAHHGSPLIFAPSCSTCRLARHAAHADSARSSMTKRMAQRWNCTACRWWCSLACSGAAAPWRAGGRVKRKLLGRGMTAKQSLSSKDQIACEKIRPRWR
ncbi:hypothetical protein FA09DRAFT_154052 [Tilletiopsis washingtonensis]|uniref:Uncharacterized protein n=1 Tax=Tilletiopsis washingtonensis TaxID=58919 RepID=A0A316Z284_9BASI|nr:hypothetical protein FA09DRAFT_154052 [Tilletiopsis washingtonensis]PWN95204.1 hypothetical protein FA09DRAFT_154052 [Tilletiopsis washingtonensis]